MKWASEGEPGGADLEPERVAVGAAAPKVPVPDGAVVDFLLGEGGRGREAPVVGQLGAPPFCGAVGRHGDQDHLTWGGYDKKGIIIIIMTHYNSFN